MFVAHISTPPTMSIAWTWGLLLQDNYRKYPIVTVLRCIATVLLTAIGSHASKWAAK